MIQKNKNVRRPKFYRLLLKNSAIQIGNEKKVKTAKQNAPHNGNVVIFTNET